MGKPRPMLAETGQPREGQMCLDVPFFVSRDYFFLVKALADAKKCTEVGGPRVAHQPPQNGSECAGRANESQGLVPTGHQPLGSYDKWQAS